MPGETTRRRYTVLTMMIGGLGCCVLSVGVELVFELVELVVLYRKVRVVGSGPA